MARTIRRQDTRIPASLAEVDNTISQMSALRRQVDAIKAEHNERVEELRAEALAKTKALQEQEFELLESLYLFAQANRSLVTNDGQRKSMRTPAGQFGWRMSPWSVTVRSAERALAFLKERSLVQFIRTKEEVDKRELLKEPDLAQTIPGVSVTQREEFFVKPLELEVEFVR